MPSSIFEAVGCRCEGNLASIPGLVSPGSRTSAVPLPRLKLYTSHTRGFGLSRLMMPVIMVLRASRITSADLANSTTHIAGVDWVIRRPYVVVILDDGYSLASPIHRTETKRKM